MQKIVELKHLFEQFFPLLAAIGLQQILAFGVNLADNFMLGRYNETTMAAAALVNQIQFMLQQIVFGVGCGVSILGAQYWGKKDIISIKRVLGVGLRLGICAGIIFCLTTAFFPNAVMHLFTNDEAVISESVCYLKIMCWTYIIYSVSAVLMYSLQSVQTAFIGTIMSACTIAINVTLNSFLIYGNFGAPELGIFGAGCATLTSRTVELIIILIYLLKIDKKIRLKFHDLLVFDKTYAKNYIRVSIPVAISAALWGFSQAVQAALLGHINTTVVAANSIAIVVFDVVAEFGMAGANVSGVIIGKTVGEENYELVKKYAKAMQIIFICIGIATGIVLFLIKDIVISWYLINPETANLTSIFITILSVTVIGTCYEFPTESGIIAGGGDTKFAPIVDNCFMWLYTIPFAFLSAFVLNWSPVVTFAILKSDQILKCIPNVIKCNRFRWIKDLTVKNTNK